ncbi:hypothetical protein N9E22_01645 [Burkholderiales bacterium]|nr:hypothetical protein [Burkholderiales bacterium]
MKKILSTALHLLIAFPLSVCAEWIKIDEGKVFNAYTDIKSLNAQPEGIYAWALYDFIDQQPEGYRSAKVLFQIDCKKERYKMLSVNTFAKSMGEGESGQPVASETWENATKNSLGHSVFTVVCN